MAAASQFVAGLKSRNRDVQNKAAQDLFLYVKTELREMPEEELVQFFDDFNHHIFDMVSSPDANEKKGGVLAISELLGITLVGICLLIFCSQLSFFYIMKFNIVILRDKFALLSG